MTRELLCSLVSDLESDACEEIKARLGLRSDRDLVRHALWRVALHADLDLPIACFELLDSPPPSRLKPSDDTPALPLFEDAPS